MRRFAFLRLLIPVLLALGVLLNFPLSDMTKIQFGLGVNIHETAKRSGAAKYSTRNVAGLVSYKLLDLPPDVQVIYQRPGFEIAAMPLFAFTLYADTDNKNDLAVETASLQFSTNTLKSHESAKTFVESLIAQFQRGHWKRYIDDLCPAVSGRSSVLDETGHVAPMPGCALDPQYRLQMDEWISTMAMTQDYQWLGDGVLATLTVRFSNDHRGLTYSVQLEFDDFSIKTRRDQQRSLQALAEGDAKGWNSTANRAKELEDLRLIIQKLEKNAVERGDTVVSR